MPSLHKCHSFDVGSRVASECCMPRCQADFYNSLEADELGRIVDTPALAPKLLPSSLNRTCDTSKSLGQIHDQDSLAPFSPIILSSPDLHKLSVWAALRVLHVWPSSLGWYCPSRRLDSSRFREPSQNLLFSGPSNLQSNVNRFCSLHLLHLI